MLWRFTANWFYLFILKDNNHETHWKPVQVKRNQNLTPRPHAQAVKVDTLLYHRVRIYVSYQRVVR